MTFFSILKGQVNGLAILKIKSFMLSFLLINLFNTAVFAQDYPGAIVDSLNKYIKPLSSKGDSVRDYLSVIHLLKEKSLVSLGESTHGTSEFFEGKADIIKGLIEQGSFKTVLMETDYFGLLNVNTFLHQSNETDLHNAFNKSGLYDVYKTKEVYHLLEWIKAYNQKHDIKDQVSIFGMDMQYTLAIANKLFQLLPDSGKNDRGIYDGLMTVKRSYDKPGAIVFNKAEQAINKEMLSRLMLLSQNQSSPEFKFMLRLMEQSLALINISDGTKRSSLRDQYMAENVLWLKRNNADNGKVVVWAHNGHIANARTPSRLPMGYYLKQALKADYYALAFAFNEGMVRILDGRSGDRGYQERQFSSSEHVNAIEHYFKDCKPGDFFLDFHEIADNKLFKQFFNKNNRMRTIGARFLGDGDHTFNPLPVLDCYDGFVFYNKTKAAQGF